MPIRIETIERYFKRFEIMTYTILILIILLLAYWIRKQEQYIKTIKEISERKSDQIEAQDKIIREYIDEL